MSRSAIYTQLFTMLSDMTIANGYTYDYTPVKSVYNSSATMKQTPYISLHYGQEEELLDGVGMNESRAMIPVEVIARIKVSHRFRSEIEYAEDVARSNAIADIKKRFGRAYKELTNCTFIELAGEIDVEDIGLDDTNKHDMFVGYTFNITYKQPI